MQLPRPTEDFHFVFTVRATEVDGERFFAHQSHGSFFPLATTALWLDIPDPEALKMTVHIDPYASKEDVREFLSQIYNNLDMHYEHLEAMRERWLDSNPPINPVVWYPGDDSGEHPS